MVPTSLISVNMFEQSNLKIKSERTWSFYGGLRVMIKFDERPKYIAKF